MRVTVIHRCNNDFEAEQIRQILESEGIECQIASDVPHDVFPIAVDGLGEVRISVVEEESARAKELIDAFFNAPAHSFELPDEYV